MSNRSPARVLIVDDREENRYVLDRILKAEGYACQQADRGSTALELARTMPDLMILDVRLPDMSGYEICQKIKANHATASIMVLQVSASFISNDGKAKALNAGADAYLTHPIDRMVLVATVRALLRLRTAEVNSRRSSDEWQATFDSLSEGVALVDESGCVARWNEAFSEMCGMKMDVKAGENASLLLERTIGTSEPLREKGRRYRGDFKCGKRAVELSVNTINGRVGSAERILILADITDRNLAEYALRTAEKLAATGKMANAIAHEINNPLEALTNLIYLGRTSDSLATTHSLLESAATELDRIARITKQALSFYRDTEKPVEIDLGQLLSEVISMVERSAAADRVRVRLQKRSTEAIYGFPGQLAQVFSNLIRNATEVSTTGSQVVVRLCCINRAGQRGNRITIHDRGNGIPFEIRGDVFDPFFTTKELRGSGLGLWVSKSLITKHQGTIRFRTSEQQGKSGTTFEVFLPVIRYGN